MNLDSYFVCPKCKGELLLKGDSYLCSKCQKHYQIIDGIPIFLVGSDTDSYGEYWDSGWKKRFEFGDHVFHKKSDEEYAEIVRMNLKLSRKNKTPVSFVGSVPNSHLVLNIGCGMDEASSLVMMGAEKYIGIDYSYSAAKYSQHSICKLGKSGITIQANAEILPIAKESVDLVYSSGVLHHTPNIELTLDEIFRVLKPSAKGVIGLYSTFSPKFIFARIVGTIKSVFGMYGKAWYNHTEGAWKTEGTFNPWTKTFSKREMVKLFEKYECKEFSIESTGFQWGDSLPILGKYIANTYLGDKIASYLSVRIGSMWIITFTK